jgi:hypothetical protein
VRICPIGDLAHQMDAVELDALEPAKADASFLPAFG